MNVEKIQKLEERILKLEREINELKSILKKEEVIIRKTPIISFLDVIENGLKEKFKEKYDEFFKDGILFMAGHIKETRWEIVSSPSDVLKISSKRVAAFAEVLANEARFLILKTLYSGPKTAKELSQITGLEGGQLYHHLRILLQHRLIYAKRRGEYSITALGVQSLLMISLIANWVIPPLEEEIEELLKGEK